MKDILKNKFLISLIIYLILQLVYIVAIYYFLGKDIIKNAVIGSIILTIYTLLIFIPVIIYEYNSFKNIKSFFKNLNKIKFVMILILSYLFISIYVLVTIFLFKGSFMTEELIKGLNENLKANFNTELQFSLIDIIIIELFFMPLTALIYFLIFLGMWIYCFEIIYNEVKNKLFAEIIISFIIFYFYLLLVIFFDYFVISNVNKFIIIVQFLIIAILYSLIGYFVRKYFDSGFLAGFFLSLIFSAENVTQFIVFHKIEYFLIITSVTLFILYLIMLIGATIYRRKMMKILTTEKR